MKIPPVRRAREGRLWALAALAYAALIVYGSLYPFSGWTTRGVKLFAFLSPDWSGHLSRADLVTNVLAYMPLGLMLARWWRHRGSLLGLIAIGLWALSQLTPLVPSLDLGNLRHGVSPIWQVLQHPDRFSFVQWASYVFYIAGLALLAITLAAPGERVFIRFFAFVACV